MKAKGNFRMVMAINNVGDNVSEESMTSTEIGGCCVPGNGCVLGKRA